MLAGLTLFLVSVDDPELLTAMAALAPDDPVAVEVAARLLDDAVHPLTVSEIGSDQPGGFRMTTTVPVTLPDGTAGTQTVPLVDLKATLVPDQGLLDVSIVMPRFEDLPVPTLDPPPEDALVERSYLLPTDGDPLAVVWDSETLMVLRPWAADTPEALDAQHQAHEAEVAARMPAPTTPRLRRRQVRHLLWLE